MNSFLFPEVQVKALFLDYDGTLAPLNVPRSQSVVSPRRISVLNRISHLIPIGVISTKDLEFLVKRTAFAHAWSGLGGLETKIGHIITRTYSEKQVFELTKALRYAKCSCTDIDGFIIEEKHDSEGTVVGFSLDWRQAENQKEARIQASHIRSYCESLAAATISYDQQPFFDVFLCPIDKGKALLEMKQKLGLIDGILYLGDSAVDNPAFHVADITIGVISDGARNNLICKYFVNFEDLPAFLEDLLKHNFRFSASLSKISPKH